MLKQFLVSVSLLLFTLFQASAAPCYEESSSTISTACTVFHDINDVAREINNGVPVLSPSFHANYTFMKMIGRGTFGVVYRAKSLALNKTVAIKLGLIGDRLNAGPLHGETQEMKILRTANEHEISGVIRMLDCGVVGEVYYIVTEEIRNGYHDPNFGQLLLRRNFSEMPATRYLAQIAMAMERLHALNIVHNDLKDHNMLLTALGEIILIDFGAAYMSTSSNVYLSWFSGSPFYGSPGARANIGNTRKRFYNAKKNDVYALGIVYFSMLANELEAIIAYEQGALMQHIMEHDWGTKLSLIGQKLLYGMLQYDESKRLNMTQVKEIALYSLKRNDPLRKTVHVQEFLEKNKLDEVVVN